MSERERERRPRIEPEVSSGARQLVDQFSDDIKAAIAAVAEETPEVAKAAARLETTKKAARWYALTLVLSVIVAAATTWLVVMYYPWPTTYQFVLRHGGTNNELCALIANTAKTLPTFICVPAAPGP